MTAYKVSVDQRALDQLERILVWWQANRPGARDLVLNELRSAAALLAVSPNLVGTSYSQSRDPRIRRVLLARSEYHVYYVVDDRQQRVRILAIWHARRERGPGP
jgi:plasmid stabilization system protein ParE